MNSVEPIRGKNTINKFAQVLRSYSERDYVLFLTGIYLGRRISDILPLKVKDVKDREYVSVSYTHLDVYKRQEESSMADMIRNLRNWTGIVEIGISD